MYLHENRELFKEIIEQVSENTGRSAVIQVILPMTLLPMKIQ